ncbi:MAG TPA: ParA family protein [Nakamurella sp.]
MITEQLGNDRYRHPAGCHGRVIAVVNGKGGTNKSTTVVALAALAAQAGHRVLIVDADDQGSATKWLGQHPNPRLSEVLRDGGASLDSIVMETAVAGLDVVPASQELKDADARLGGQVGIQNSLRDALAGSSRRDVVLIDTPGDVGLMTIMALIAAGEVLVTLPPEAPIYAELPDTERLLADVQRRANRDLTFIGVLATSVPIRGQYTTTEARNVLADLRARHGQSLLPDVIHETPKFGESYDAAEPISVYAPDSRAADEYRQVARFLGLVASQEVVNV